jgi:predicted DNA-binding protein (MmcQ/YjbR family)
MKPSLAWKALKKHAMAKPGAWEDHPWGEPVYKCGKKIFAFVGFSDEGQYSLTCKLPDSSEAALSMFGWATPTGYGLGKSGWVTASFETKDDVPKDLLLQWIDESYTAVAPKRKATRKKRK